jgi:hypothetical protein
VTESLASVDCHCEIKSPSSVTGRAFTNASDTSSPELGATPVNRMTRGLSPGHWGSTIVSSNVRSTAGSVTINSPQQSFGLSSPLLYIVKQYETGDPPGTVSEFPPAFAEQGTLPARTVFSSISSAVFGIYNTESINRQSNNLIMMRLWCRLVFWVTVGASARKISVFSRLLRDRTIGSRTSVLPRQILYSTKIVRGDCP